MENSKQFLKTKGIHPTEPIYWDLENTRILLDELLKEYANQQTADMQKEIDELKSKNKLLKDAYNNQVCNIEGLANERDLYSEQAKKLQSKYTKLKEAADEMANNLKNYMIGKESEFEIVTALENYKNLKDES